MRPDRGKPQPQVALARRCELAHEFFGDLVLIFGVRPVHFETKLLRAVRETGVRIARKRRKLCKKGAAVADDARRVHGELFVPDGQCFKDEGAVALL